MDQLLRLQCFPERGNVALVGGAVGLFQISVDILYNSGPDQKALQRKDSRPWIWFGCFWNPPAEVCSAPGNFCSWRDSSYSWPFLPFQIGGTAEFANLSGHILRLPQQQKHCFCLQAISQAFRGKHHILLSFLFGSLLQQFLKTCLRPCPSSSWPFLFPENVFGTHLILDWQ